jgi:GT2 family glycosyltransferase
MSEAMSHFDTPAQMLVPVVEAVICVPTFRRPEMLTRTLRSLTEQRTSVPFAVVVVENDSAGREGYTVAARFVSGGRLRGHLVIEPAQGNVHAINRAFATALAQYEDARYFLMIDDDELAAPDWLETMISAARENDCDIVGGPVLPVFAASIETHRNHPVFQPAYSASGPVQMIYGSGNCLITRTAFERIGSLFDPRFNFLGGGDTEFFTRARLARLRFFWSQEAVVQEIVGSERVTRAWILKRGLRIGAINYCIDRLAARSGIARVRVPIKNVGVVAFAAYKGLRLLLAGSSPLEVLHPLVIAFGRCLAAFGVYPEQYRARAESLRP